MTRPATVSAATVRGVHATAAVLPASVNLTAYAPPVGNQGQVGSCAAWATDYTALGYWENRQGIAGGVLAPMYTYSQLVNGQNVGTYIDSHLVIAEQQGVDDQSNYAQGNYDYTHTPTSAERANAAKWKLTSYSDLAVQNSSSSTVTQQSIEAALAAGTPVVIGIPVYANFEYITSANHGFYAAASGQFLGGHAVTALGYDSTGLRIENSWGTGWGDSGYATLSWAFINADVFQAVAVGQLAVPPPVDASLPVVTGTDRQGQTLTATSGVWSPTGTSYAYQWQRSSNAGSTWSAITGATSATYVLATPDVGARVRVAVTATNAGGQSTATSTAAGSVASGAPVATAAPALAGTARQGQPLTVSNGTWIPSAISYAYQWQRSTNAGSTWSAITGATSQSYIPGSADVTARLRVLVTALNGYGQAVATSAVVGPVLSGAPVIGSAPAVSGSAIRGMTLTVGSGTWSPAASSYSYQWQRSVNSGIAWLNITGATGPSYTTTKADEAAEIRVVVTGLNAYGQQPAATAATAAVKASAPVNTAAPTISGSARRGSTLSATTGTWTGAGNAYAYQWQRNSGSGYVNIAAATGATYAPTQTDLGVSLRVLVTATNPDATTAQASLATTPVG